MKKTTLAMLLAAVAGGALADINVGVTLSATGPAASLGIPEKNTIELLPKTIAGQKVELHRPRRRLGHDDRGQERQEADQREQGGRRHRLDDDAEFAGDDRCRGRKRDTDDLDGRLGAHRRADG